MEYIILAFAIFTIFYSTLSLTLVRTLKPSHGAIKGYKSQTAIQETHCRACNIILVDHNHGCQWADLQRIPIATPDTTPDITATIADIENHLLADYERYRDTLIKLKALPVADNAKCIDCVYGYDTCAIRDICKAEAIIQSSVEHRDRDTENNAIENLSVTVDYEMTTSGLEAGSIVAYDQSLTWADNIKIWKERETTIYPDGYYQGIVLYQDGKQILGTEDVYGKHKFKTLIKFEKVKKTRKSKIGVC